MIEAGVFHPNDPLIELPRKLILPGAIRVSIDYPSTEHIRQVNIGVETGNATYDWLFASAPQANAGGRVIQETRRV